MTIDAGEFLATFSGSKDKPVVFSCFLAHFQSGAKLHYILYTQYQAVAFELAENKHSYLEAHGVVM